MNQKYDPLNCPCLADSGANTSSWKYPNTWSGKGYFPTFPASSPYVLSVGATMGQKHLVPSVGEAEIACQSQLGGVITSGGGFSSYYPVPPWQINAQKQYFSSLTASPAPGYNAQGRGYPDISLLGVDYSVMLNGQIDFVYGTSCSSPVLAGMITLLNSLRARKGLAPVGFMNPTLYSNRASSSYRDVTSGTNEYCSTNTNPSSALKCNGFAASTGWDPVTGFGSITFVNLAALFNVTVKYSSPSQSFQANDIFTYSVLGE